MPPPRLEFDWEQSLFRGLLCAWERFRPGQPPSDPGHAARLEPQRAALTALAQVIAREPLRIRVCRETAGIRGTDILLPASLDLAPNVETNRRLYVLLTVVLARMRRGTRASFPPRDALAPLESLRVARESVDALEAELPAFADLHALGVRLALVRRRDPSALQGRERALEAARRAALMGLRPWEDRALRDALRGSSRRGQTSEPIPIWGEWLPSPEDPSTPGPALDQPPGARISTEVDASAIEELRRIVIDPTEQADSVLIHTFEKAETLDSYRGGARDFDGSDELVQHLKALEEVDLGALIRTNSTASSLLRADLDLGPGIPDAADAPSSRQGIRYDEWDDRRARYRVGWCTVYPEAFHDEAPNWARDKLHEHRRLVDDLRRRLAIHRCGRLAIDRQLDGEDFDLTSIVDARADMSAGRTPDPRLYVRQERRRRDFATTVLLDLSLSTDAWIAGRRVLDVAREAVLVLGEVAHDLGDRLQVLGFASRTRNQCHAWTLKDWNDPWPRAAARLGALEPRGYTRIGPALRHATAELSRARAERRLLLLISDGKPTDYDRYEGAYGIADVRRAVQEAQRSSIVLHALAVQAEARETLPSQFGPGCWHILQSPSQLVSAVTAVYGKLTAG